MVGGIKRDRDGNKRSEETNPRVAVVDSQFSAMFLQFRDELDQHYDRKERVVKASRDVTALSKKIIFSLQRVKDVKTDLPTFAKKDIDSRLEEIRSSLATVETDLQGINRYRYSGPLRCLEELVEALSFAHYLQHQSFISLEDTSAAVPANILLTEHDYMYGIFDLFGEMMRFATVTTAYTGKLAGADTVGGRTILQDIQELGSSFEILPEIPTKDFSSKMSAMRTSVRKVERLGYGLAIRGTERPKGWIPDMKDDPEPMSVE